MTVYIKRNPIIGELPKESGLYLTNRGLMQFTSAYDRWYGLDPQWWLQEIELPSEDIIERKADNVDSDNSTEYNQGYYDGFINCSNFIFSYLSQTQDGGQEG